MEENITIQRRNRYNDVITFEKQGNMVYMRGHFDKGIGVTIANDYDTAYIVYMTDEKNPEKDLTYDMFVRKMEVEHDFFWKYAKHVKSKEGVIAAIDPSGGPYVAVGSNLAYYFQCEDRLVVEKIELHDEEIAFVLEEDKKLLD